MARFMTRYGMVDFPTRSRRSNPKKRKGRGKKKARRKAKASARKAVRKSNPKAKACSKKVGRWRVEAKGRTVYAAGAKHSYKTSAAACAAYKRLTSVKKVESFVIRYGKKATKKVVAGAGKKSTKRKTKRRNAPISASQASAMKAVLAAHGNPKRRTRNAPLSASEKRSLRAVLKKHGYLR